MLFTYPDLRYLSGCCLPIRMLFTYPSASIRGLPAGCGVPVMWLQCASSFDHVVPANLARNSSQTISAIEAMSLQFQRFRGVLKSDRVELCARFVGKYVR